MLTHIQLHVLFFSLDGHAKQNLGKAFTATRLSVICLIQSCETVFKKHWRKIKLSLNCIIRFMILLTTKTLKNMLIRLFEGCDGVCNFLLVYLYYDFTIRNICLGPNFKIVFLWFYKRLQWMNVCQKLFLCVSEKF